MTTGQKAVMALDIERYEADEAKPPMAAAGVDRGTVEKVDAIAAPKIKITESGKAQTVPLMQTNPTQPEAACTDCWRVWLCTRQRTDIGYCWHGSVAWRIRPSGEFITAAGVDRVKHLAMVRALRKREPQGFAARTAAPS